VWWGPIGTASQGMVFGVLCFAEPTLWIRALWKGQVQVEKPSMDFAMWRNGIVHGI